MNAFLVILFITALYSLIILLPDIMPKCDCCGIYKLRPLIKIHKTIKISIGYKGVKSVCSKCSERYGILDYDDYLKLVHSKKIAKINLLNIFHN